MRGEEGVNECVAGLKECVRRRNYINKGMKINECGARLNESEKEEKLYEGMKLSDLMNGWRGDCVNGGVEINECVRRIWQD